MLDARAKARSRLFEVAEPFQHEPEVVERVGCVGLERRGALELAARILEVAHLEEDLALEGAEHALFAGGLDGATHQEERAVELVLIEERLRLEVVDLGLGVAVETRQAARGREHAIALGDRLLVRAELLDQDLGAIQVRGYELGIGLRGLLELDEGLVDLALVPQDLAATVVGLGAIRMRLQRLVEPSERLVGAATVRSLHRLVEAIPITILVAAHRSFAGRRPGGRTGQEGAAS